ncbi:HD domain-containing protein [Bacillus cereus]|nr:HD domain-containing protein [Bacillus cereus]
MKVLIEKLDFEHKNRMEETLLLMISILELKYTYTKEHSESVSEYVTILAKETYQFTESELRRFHFTCLLHEIGKIGISDGIINKTSALTDEEYGVIKTHPILGLRV